jgi:plastocyanin
MRLTTAAAVLMALTIALWAFPNTRAIGQVNGNDSNISVTDDCLPGDPGWNPTGGCTLKPHQGDVSEAEFTALLSSPLTSTVIGHPSWRNEPSHLATNQGRAVRVTNTGGRNHTFTKVEEFGGGTIAPLSAGLTKAAECPASPANIGPLILAPGATTQVTNLQPGLHKFQCCFHPWMRATIRVE